MPLEKSFDPAEEAAIYAAWERGGPGGTSAFAAGAGARREETFSVLIPPPNVTGVLHMGHAFNNTLQDVLTRWHRMRGFDTLWQPGTDHAGIATQMVVERELAKEGLKRTDLTREDFTARVWQQKRESRGTIIGQLKRLGASCDWSREAFTMSGAPDAPPGEEGNFHDAVIRVFVDMYEKGLIYRGKRLVNWDPKFETAISDLEVENVETDGFMWHFKYHLQGNETYEYIEKDEHGGVRLRETRDWISIATTRPETMLGDGAVAVHPSDERYAAIVGKLVEIPVGPKEHRRLIPIITDEYPDPTFGSGAVKITGAHDVNDHAVATRNGIPLYSLMDTKGAMRADGLPYAEAAARAGAIAAGAGASDDVTEINLVPEHLRGLDRFDARARVIEEITAEGLAVMVPPTDPRLGAPKKAKPPAAPAPAPGPRAATTASTTTEPPLAPSSSGSTGGSPTTERALEAGDPRIKSEDDRIAPTAPMTPPLAPEEGGEMPTEPDALVPLVEPKLIMQPTGDRSKVVIEPMLTDQWFVDTKQIVGPALDAVRNGEVTILPDQDRKVYEHWLENIEPWTISRQLWWGHRIPFWYSSYPDNLDGFRRWMEYFKLRVNSSNEDRRRMSKGPDDFFQTVSFGVCARSEEEAAKLIARRVPYDVQVEFGTVFDMKREKFTDRAFPYGVNSETGQLTSIVAQQDPDVLDTWFSSGLWPIGTLGWPEDTEAMRKYFPTSVLVTGFDIIFFWVARMIMMQYAVVGQRPFGTVYVHALVRDESGKKMSKSLGNVLDPIDLIDSYGADAVRFTLASIAAMGRDLRLSTKRIEGYRNFVTKLWNAARFAEMNGAWDAHGLRMVCTRDVRALSPVNAWIVGETARAFAAHDAALEAYRFDDAARGAYAFVWGTVCDWYLELSKPLLTGEVADLKAETQATVAWVIDRCLILLHPVMPFVTEALWSRLGARDAMLALTPWPEFPSDLNDPAADAEIAWTISLIEGIRSVRGEMNVPGGAVLSLVAVERTGDAASWEARNAALIERIARIDGIAPGEAPKGAATIAVAGATYALPLAGIIDVDAEKARLDKALGKLAKELGGLRGRLGNPRFAASAPPEVVAETRANLDAREAEEARLTAARSRLGEMA